MSAISSTTVVEPVAYVYAGNVSICPAVDREDPNIEAVLSAQRKQAFDWIRGAQEQRNNAAPDGYISYLGHIYRVNASSRDQKKITGKDAKPIKQLIDAARKKG